MCLTGMGFLHISGLDKIIRQNPVFGDTYIIHVINNRNVYLSNRETCHPLWYKSVTSIEYYKFRFERERKYTNSHTFIVTS